MRSINPIAITILFFFAFTMTVLGQNAKRKDSDAKDRPVKIKSKPSIDASIIDKCFDRRSKGKLVVQLAVTFNKSAEVTGVAISKPSGCDDLDTEATKVAKKIKFSPQIKDGEPVTVTKTLEYSIGIS